MRARAVIAAAMLAAAPAAAQDRQGSGHGLGQGAQSYPHLDAELGLELTYERPYRSTEGRRHDLVTETELEIGLHVSPELALVAGLKLEDVRDPDPDRDRWLDRHGLYVETLKLQYRTETLEIDAGKFTQPFGIAWDEAPGIWGREFAKDYELVERWGVRIGMTGRAGDFGEHTLSASAFFLDRTVLSQSVITRRERVRKSDGGPSNTGNPSSFAIALDSAEFVAAPGLRTHLALLHQERGSAGEADEGGLVAAVEYEVELDRDAGVYLVPIVEYARFRNAAGARGTDASYLTAGGQLRHGPWRFTLVQAFRHLEPAGGGDERDRQTEISAGYRFDNGIGVDAGWRHTREDGETSQAFGVMLTYDLHF